MKHLLFVLALAFVAPALPFACSAPAAKEHVLLPELKAAWPSVHAAAERGGMSLATLNAFETGLKAGTPVLADWVPIEVAAHAGIEARITAGEVTPGVAASLHERVRLFGVALNTHFGGS